MGLRSLAFLDTSSLLVSAWNAHGEDHADEDPAKRSVFWHSELPQLVVSSTVVLARRNFEELKKHRDGAKPGLASRAAAVLRWMAPLFDVGEVQIVGDANDPFADAILLSAALKFRTQHHLQFLTQDRALAQDLTTVGSFASVRPRGPQRFVVSRIGRSGHVHRWRFPSAHTPSGPAHSGHLGAAAMAPDPAWWE